MKIQIIIAGFNRCLSHTYPIIYKNVIEALQEDGVDLRVDLFISRTKRKLTNTRSSEVGFSEWSIPPLKKSDSLRTYNKSVIDWCSRKTYSRAKKQGDPWPESNFKSLHNVVSWLKMLEIAGQHIDKSSDAILYLRPDLVPLDRFEINRYVNLIPQVSIFPYWQSWGGA